MTLEVTVGPPRLTINSGRSVLITEQDGHVDWPTDKGYYDLDTRLISSWHLFADGLPWQLLNSGNLTHCASKIYLTNPALVTEAGLIPGGSLGLVIGRCLGEGLHEDFDIMNNGALGRAVQSRDRDPQRLRRPPLR